MTTTTGPRIVGPNDGRLADLGSIAARMMIWTEDVPGGAFSLVEHPMPPRRLAAPIHKHSREDEYSYVLEGRMGALLGDDVVYAEAGDTVFKPRDQWHTFWNAGDTPVPDPRDHRARRVRALLRRARRRRSSQGPPSPEKLGELGEKYGIEFQPESVARLCEEHGLEHPMLNPVA